MLKVAVSKERVKILFKEVNFSGKNLYSKFSFGEVNRLRYIMEYTVGNVVKCNLINLISGGISDVIPPKMKNLNMVIPILMKILYLFTIKIFVLSQTCVLQATEGCVLSNEVRLN